MCFHLHRMGHRMGGTEGKGLPRTHAVGGEQRFLNTWWFCGLNICPGGTGLRLLTHYTQLSHEQIIRSLMTPLNTILGCGRARLYHHVPRERTES